VQVIVSWKSPKSAFDAEGFHLTNRPGRGIVELGAVNPRVARTRRATSVTLKVTNLRSGTLQFAVVAKRLHSPARVTTRVTRQAK